MLGGGGIAGIAWHAGVLQGLRDGGVDLDHWDLVVGTSAGAYAGARLLVAGGPDRAYAEDTECELTADEAELAALTGPTFIRSLRLARRPRLALASAAWYAGVLLLTLVRHAARHGIRHTLGVWRAMRDADFHPDRVHTFGKAIGSIALLGRRGSDEALIQYLTRMLGDAAWPSTRFVTVTADVATGRREPLSAGSGLPFIRAVAASMALPGFVVPVRYGSRRLMDGGVTSNTSADLAGSFDRILVIAPIVTTGVVEEIEALRRAGKRVALIRPSDRAAALWSDLRMMDPKHRAEAARAGRDDGLEAARDLVGHWEREPAIVATA